MGNNFKLSVDDTRLEICIGQYGEEDEVDIHWNQSISKIFIGKVLTYIDRYDYYGSVDVEKIKLNEFDWPETVKTVQKYLNINVQSSWMVFELQW